ncbi:MAG: flagellar basal body L-ring protein FlgH [Verrucomicrobia bacterium]|nr:MAG: flagellar basal body L-ring protein FlgH [Verrucomicrobiota bacterium]
MKRLFRYSFSPVCTGLALSLAGIVPVASAGSLWTKKGADESPMVSDLRAQNIGDILTVVVQETASAQSSRRTKTDKSAKTKASIDKFLYSPDGSDFLTKNGVMPSLDLGGSTDFTGGGQITNSQSISGQAAVTVIDLLPNGNLVIEGSRLVSFSGEKQYAILRGVVRPQDIQNGNIVLSSSIADARVEFISQGAISVTQKKGWWTRFYDAINPF